MGDARRRCAIDGRGVPAGAGEAGGGQRQLPCTGHPDHVDRVLGHAVVGEALARAGHQGVGDARVPAAGDDREA